MLLKICTLFRYPKGAPIVSENRVISEYSTDQKKKYVRPCRLIVPSFSAYVTYIYPFCTVSRFLSNSSRDTSVYILCSCYISKFSVLVFPLRQMAALEYRKEQQHHVTTIHALFNLYLLIIRFLEEVRVQESQNKDQIGLQTMHSF